MIVGAHDVLINMLYKTQRVNAIQIYKICTKKVLFENPVTASFFKK